MKILCVFGKYAYGDPSRELSPEYSSFIPALESLGHTVLYFEIWQRTKYKNYAELNLELFKTILEERPDILFCVPLNYEIWIETLKAIRALGSVTTICWTTDDSWKYREVSRFIGKFYHVISTTYKDKIPLYRKDGIENVFLTQWAANSKSLQPPISAKNCRYKVSFIGAAHGNRKDRIVKLKQLGIDVTCFGYGWPNGPVKSEDIPAIMQQSVISLNFANSKGQNQIKARNFEVPGAGGFLLTEYAPELETYYRIGEEIDIFENTTELARKIEYYLINTDKRDEMALAGYERTRREHTYDMRLQQLISHAQKVRSLEKKRNITIIETKQLIAASKLHSMPPVLRTFRFFLMILCNLAFGRIRGPRAARRIVFESSWRIFGQKTYMASGLPGRLFPNL